MKDIFTLGIFIMLIVGICTADLTTSANFKTTIQNGIEISSKPIFSEHQANQSIFTYYIKLPALSDTTLSMNAFIGKSLNITDFLFVPITKTSTRTITLAPSFKTKNTTIPAITQDQITYSYDLRTSSKTIKTGEYLLTVTIKANTITSKGKTITIMPSKGTWNATISSMKLS